jgi:hypothetical protein
VIALVSIAFQAFLSSAGGVYSEMILKQNIEIPLVVKVKEGSLGGRERERENRKSLAKSFVELE